MAKEYLVRPRAARTVFEDFELIDTGVLDAAGNRVMARQKLDPIGFIRHKG